MDRRSSPRVKRRAQCTIQQGKTVVDGTLLDVSEGGMSLASAEDFEQGSLVKVEFDALNQKIRANAVIWHSRPVRYMGSPGFLFGMMIDEACPEYQLLLPRRTPSDAKSVVAGTIPSLEEAEAEARKLEASAAAEPTPPEVEVQTKPPATEEAQADFKKSLQDGHRDTGGQSYRVRAKKRSQPRTKTLSLTAESEGAARDAASEALGADWEVLEVTRAA